MAKQPANDGINELPDLVETLRADGYTFPPSDTTPDGTQPYAITGTPGEEIAKVTNGRAFAARIFPHLRLGHAEPTSDITKRSR